LVLNQLDELGLSDNTVVIFTSDNGGVSSGDAYATSNLPYRGGKGRQWEGGIREPYYIRVPGLTQPGSVHATPVTGTDFYPTILELAGLPLRPEQHVDGISLLPALQGKPLPKRDLFWHYPHYGNQGGEPSAIIRSGDWKLIHYYEDGRDELYHLRKDLGEQHDLAAAEKERATALRAKLDAWLKETGAKIPQPDARFDAEKKKQHLQRMETGFLQAMEKQHARFLSPTFQPNPTWWGSLIAKD
jgi:arylsulfatase A-like enzyme